MTQLVILKFINLPVLAEEQAMRFNIPNIIRRLTHVCFESAIFLKCNFKFILIYIIYFNLSIKKQVTYKDYVLVVKKQYREDIVFKQKQNG